MEPAALGKGVISGSHVDKNISIFKRLDHFGGVIWADNTNNLTQAMLTLSIFNPTTASEFWRIISLSIFYRTKPCRCRSCAKIDSIPKGASMITTPSFWYHRSITGYIIMMLLWPLSILWRLVSYYRRLWTRPVQLALPVICIGNLTAGGTGKTPLVRQFALTATASGLNPVILSKGYGGKEKGPMIVSPESPSDMVGDEPLGRVVYALLSLPKAAKQEPDG